MTAAPIRRALLGVVWLSATGYFAFVLNFGLNLLLARLLFPKDFGQFALAGSLAEILSIATGFSFSQAIIQMQNAPGVADTAYVLSVRLYAALVVGGAVLAAVLRPHFPGIFIPLFFALFVVRNLSVISYVYSATLERTFQYNQISRVRLISVVLSIVAALALARAGAGVWSLLGRELILSGVTLVGFRVVSRWRYRGGYNLETARELWRFGWQMFVARALETIWYRGDTALLGVLAGTVTLGFYDRSRYLAEFGHYVVSFAAVQVAFPVYASLAGRREALTYAYRLSHGLLVRLMFPALIWLALFPREIVGLLYGAGVRWAETAAILPWLAAFGFIFPVAENIKVLLTGIGRLRDAVWMRLVQVLVALPLLVPAIKVGGPYAAGAVMFLSELAGLIVGYRALRREVTSLYLDGYWRPALAAVIAGGSVAALRAAHLVPWVGRIGYAANLAAAAAVYLVCLALIDRQQLQEHLWSLLAGFRGETPAAWNGMPNGAAGPAEGDGRDDRVLPLVDDSR
ncbi:MAG TPA: oligosaccharide flippase family protein [bacterium]|nr:oligosaccharide flippase family protein [bacterium]